MVGPIGLSEQATRAKNIALSKKFFEDFFEDLDWIFLNPLSCKHLYHAG